MTTRWLLLILFVATPAGCRTTKPVVYQSRRLLAVNADSVQAEQVWRASQEALRRHFLKLDRLDRRAGIITTKPTISKHYFEFWRHDVYTTRDVWEASLNPIRRWVELRMTSESPSAPLELAIVVHKQRLSAPDRQFNSSGAAYEFFGDNLPSTTGHLRVTAADERWIDYGRDRATEDYLLRRILSSAGMPPDNQTPDPQDPRQAGDESQQQTDEDGS
jgi:hypothetical protein